MKKADHEEIARRFANGDELDEAVRQGVRAALAEHRRRHNSIAIWRDGKVVVIPADQIPEDDVA